MNRRVIVLIICLMVVHLVRAQKLDSIQSINGVEITADKISAFAAGLKIQKIDSISLSIRQNISISTLLNEHSPVYLRSYGPGGISTLSMRGTNASQSGIFWNGISLNQPNMGQADLSRISTFDFSDISMQSGSASALLGSGIIGGSLHLTNTMEYSSPFKTSILISGASAGKIASGVKISGGGTKMAYSGSFTGNWNENNFWYTDYSGEQKRLEHALAKSVSTVHQAEYILNPRQRLSAGLWYQATNRQVPPTMTMASSDQHQWDQAIRSSLQWSYIGNDQVFAVKTAYIDEKEQFKSESAEIDANYHLNTYQAELEYKKYLNKKFTLGSGASSRLIRADVPYYQELTWQPEGSIWAAIAYHQPQSGIKAAFSLRQDFSGGYKIPFCPSLSAEFPIAKSISASLAISRNFRVPTMNDRYWVPGGNPDLEPENSWNFEAGASFGKMKTSFTRSKIMINLYSVFIDNYIQWVPGASSFWSAQNVSKVWSRGIEISSNTDFSYAGFKGYFKLGYNYTPSTYNGDNDLSGKQLIYTPEHKVTEVFDLDKGNYYALFTYSLTGKRYVNSDNSASLPSYSLLNVFTGYNFLFSKLDLRLQFEINNLFDAEYQSVLYYPEPGRSYAVTVLLSTHK